MAKSAPPSALVRVTVWPLAAFLSANTPLAETVTKSPLTRPLLTAAVVLTVALVLPS